jgi:hypothetical protein
MPISDPLLNRKLNMLQQDFGLAMSFEANATRMRMRREDQNIAAFMVFEQDCQRKFFHGFEYDGRQVQGFSQMVRSYFEAFPHNLHDSLFHELAAWLESGMQAKLDAIRMQLNQLLSGEDHAQYQSAFAIMERDIRFIRESEPQRLYTDLREIRQRREYAVQSIPEKTGWEKLKAWFKENPVGIAFSIVGLVLGFAISNFDTLFRLLHTFFR